MTDFDFMRDILDLKYGKNIKNDESNEKINKYFEKFIKTNNYPLLDFLHKLNFKYKKYYKLLKVYKYNNLKKYYSFITFNLNYKTIKKNSYLFDDKEFINDMIKNNKVKYSKNLINFLLTKKFNMELVMEHLNKNIYPTKMNFEYLYNKKSRDELKKICKKMENYNTKIKIKISKFLYGKIFTNEDYDLLIFIKNNGKKYKVFNWIFKRKLYEIIKEDNLVVLKKLLDNQLIKTNIIRNNKIISFAFIFDSNKIYEYLKKTYNVSCQNNIGNYYLNNYFIKRNAKKISETKIYDKLKNIGYPENQTMIEILLKYNDLLNFEKISLKNKIIPTKGILDKINKIPIKIRKNIKITKNTFLKYLKLSGNYYKYPKNNSIKYLLKNCKKIEIKISDNFYLEKYIFRYATEDILNKLIEKKIVILDMTFIVRIINGYYYAKTSNSIMLGNKILETIEKDNLVIDDEFKKNLLIYSLKIDNLDFLKKVVNKMKLEVKLDDLILVDNYDFKISNDIIKYVFEKNNKIIDINILNFFIEYSYFDTIIYLKDDILEFVKNNITKKQINKYIHDTYGICNSFKDFLKLIDFNINAYTLEIMIKRYGERKYFKNMFKNLKDLITEATNKQLNHLKSFFKITLNQNNIKIVEPNYEPSLDEKIDFIDDPDNFDLNIEGLDEVIQDDKMGFEKIINGDLYENNKDDDYDEEINKIVNETY